MCMIEPGFTAATTQQHGHAGCGWPADATWVIQFQAGGDMRAGCGGRDMYLRLQPLYLGPLTAVNNLATGLNWPTVAA